MSHRLGKKLLAGLGGSGFLAFFSLFILTFSQAERIEQAATPILKSEVKQALQQQLDNLLSRNSSRIGKLLRFGSPILSTESLEEFKEYTTTLNQTLPSLIERQLVLLNNIDCDCRNNWQAKLTAIERIKINSAEQIKQDLVEFSHGKYMHTLNTLTENLRLLFAANVILFVFFLVILKIRPCVIFQLCIPTTLLVLSSMVISYLYFFEQSWFYTLLYSDYFGYCYLTYLSAIFLLLVDIALNRARVTSGVVNRPLNSICGLMLTSAR